MTTVSELIKSFNPATARKEEASFELFAKIFELSYWDYSQQFPDLMVKHWVYSWICTDTRVGLAFYYLNDELVAISTQTGRKSTENVMFISSEIADRVRQFAIRCIIHDEPQYDIVDFNSEIDDEWKQRSDI